MKAVLVLLVAVLLFGVAVPIGILTIGVAAVVPAIAEQVRLDPCSAINTTAADSTALLSNRPATGFSLPKWGGPRHQSLHSAAQQPSARIKALYVAAGNRYKVPWQLLAGIGMAETRHGRNNTTSSAGAKGLMQFMPGTFRAYGVDGNGDGKKDIHNDADSVFSAAHYLVASGVKNGAAGVIKALWAYNRSISYRNDVLYYAWAYAGKGGVVVDASDPQDCDPAQGDIPGLDAPLPGFGGVCKPSHSSAERGLRRNALRGLRCIKEAFPQIKWMGGRRSSSSSTCNGALSNIAYELADQIGVRPANTPMRTVLDLVEHQILPPTMWPEIRTAIISTIHPEARSRIDGVPAGDQHLWEVVDPPPRGRDNPAARPGDRRQPGANRSRRDAARGASACAGHTSGPQAREPRPF